MSLLRYQNVYQYNENNNIQKKWIELLAWQDTLLKLFSIYKIGDNIIRENELKNIDYYMINVIKENKQKINDIKKDKNLDFVNLNLFPWTLEEIINNKSKQKDLKILKETITSVEIIEDLNWPNNYLKSNRNNLNKIIIEKLGFNLWLDDVTMWLLLDADKKGFIIEELKNYIEHNIISFIKIDIKLTKLIIKDSNIKKNLFNVLFDKKLGLNKTKVVFEWIENKEELKVITDCLSKNKEFIKQRNIQFLFQWYLFHKPSVLVKK